MESSAEILLYAESPFFSGAEQQLIRNFKHLGQQGHESRLLIVTSSRGSEEFQSLSLGNKAEVRESKFVAVPGGNPVTNFWREQLGFALGIGRAIRACSGKRLEMVHVNNGGHPGSAGARGFATAVALFFPRIRLLLSVNNLIIPYCSIPRLLDFPSDRILAKRASWITGSKAAKKALEKILGVPSWRAEVVANGVPQPICKGNHAQIDPRVTRQISGKKIGLSIGHLVSRKGHRVLIEALHMLKRSSSLPKDWVFIIEGEGTERAHLETLVNEYRLTQEVLLIGRFECVAELYVLCDLFVHPSIANEDLPNVISEAMSFSLPVVATLVGGVAEQVAHNDTGRIVEPGDSESLSRELSSLMNSKNLRSELGRRARAAYLEKFSPDVALEKFRRIYGR